MDRPQSPFRSVGRALNDDHPASLESTGESVHVGYLEDEGHTTDARTAVPAAGKSDRRGHELPVEERYHRPPLRDELTVRRCPVSLLGNEAEALAIEPPGRSE